MHWGCALFRSLSCHHSRLGLQGVHTVLAIVHKLIAEFNTDTRSIIVFQLKQDFHSNFTFHVSTYKLLPMVKEWDDSAADYLVWSCHLAV